MNCPDCERYLKEDAHKCLCGWKAQPKQTVDPYRHRCAYMSNGTRCRLPGACSNSIHGSDKWYCRFHLKAINDSDHRYGAQVIADVLKGVAP